MMMNPPRDNSVAVLPVSAGPAETRAPRVPAGLWRTFGWLLWGDFVLVLMEQVVPSLVPILLREHQLSNTSISLIMGTIPTVFSLLVMPIISYRSDQLRTRWGRRIPFLAAVTPFIVLSLCAIPFAPDVAAGVGRLAGLPEGSGALLVTVMFALAVSSYTLLNMVCSGCYTFLLPDVVPGQFMGRFMSLFRIFGFGGLFVFNYFFLGFASTHMKEVFIGVAFIYGLGFSLVCWKVKEPAYPPPTDRRTVNPLAVFRSYAHECFRHPLYLWLYAALALYGVSQVAGNLFDVLFMKETLGMDLEILGKVRAWSTIAPIPLAYFCGHLIDRWSSQRAIVVCALLLSVGKACGFFFITDSTTYVVWTIIYNVMAFFWGVTYSAYLVNMLPRDRYGQFASCNVLISALAVMAASPVCGLFFDTVQDYRYVYLWPAVLTAFTAVFFWKINGYWRQCGGPDNYRAP